jgi:hypothetical protein
MWININIFKKIRIHLRHKHTVNNHLLHIRSNPNPFLKVSIILDKWWDDTSLRNSGIWNFDGVGTSSSTDTCSSFRALSYTEIYNGFSCATRGECVSGSLIFDQSLFCPVIIHLRYLNTCNINAFLSIFVSIFIELDMYWLYYNREDGM